jgi:hypothetical protein
MREADGKGEVTSLPSDRTDLRKEIKGLAEPAALALSCRLAMSFISTGTHLYNQHRALRQIARGLQSLT